MGGQVRCIVTGLPAGWGGPDWRETVLGALEGGCDGDEFAMMERLHRLTGTEVPRNLAGLQGRPVRHRDVIDKEQMLDYVLAEVMRS